MTRDDERWRALVSASARGEVLSERDSVYLETFGHPADEAIWAAFAHLPDAPRAGERETSELAAAVLRAAASSSSSPADAAPSPAGRGRRWAISGAALAAAAVLGVLSSSPRGGPARALAGMPVEIADLDGVPRAVALARPVLPGWECRDAFPGFTVCAAPGGDVQWLPRPRLARGHARLVANAGAATELRLATPVAEVRGRGRPVVAELELEGDRLTITVLEGEVAAWRGDRELAVVTTETPLVLPTASTPRRAKPGPSVEAGAAEALARAQALAHAGRLGDAREAYHHLVERYPSSPEAGAGMVTLGQLELRRGRPRAALALFSRSLERGSRALAPEAEYGRIRALRALGEADAASQAIGRFLQRYPTSPYVSRLRSAPGER